MTHLAELEKLAFDVRTIAENARNEFGRLSVEQLNWKPSVDRWSVAQCLDHLITTNTAYFPVIEKVEKGTKKPTIVERLPVLPKLWARLLINSWIQRQLEDSKHRLRFNHHRATSAVQSSTTLSFIKTEWWSRWGR